VPGEPRWSPADRLRLRANTWLLPRLEAGSPWAHRLWRANAATFAPLAEAWALRGCSILARGRVVVTDRLHGHILSLLQGIPHVAMDNSYGKVRAVHDTWTHESDLVRWADTPAEAIAAARDLLA
jgi:exopolysaccharide biosynthesis predicted pyruvyltransferase EpsI